MFQAQKIMEQIGATVLSPSVTSDRTLAKEITADTEYEHLKAIDDCDVLFICNNRDDGYLGESTKCHIYYAYAQKKTIAFWREPLADKQLSFIPHEYWEPIKEFSHEY
jgi:nucleoside 2-deoxyribosyltransferase